MVDHITTKCGHLGLTRGWWHHAANVTITSRGHCHILYQKVVVLAVQGVFQGQFHHLDLDVTADGCLKYIKQYYQACSASDKACRANPAYIGDISAVCELSTTLYSCSMSIFPIPIILSVGSEYRYVDQPELSTMYAGPTLVWLTMNFQTHSTLCW